MKNRALAATLALFFFGPPNAMASSDAAVAPQCSPALLAKLRATPTSNRRGLADKALYETHVLLYIGYNELRAKAESTRAISNGPELQARAYSKHDLGEPQAMAERKIAQEEVFTLMRAALRYELDSILLLPCLKELERIGRL